LILLLLPEAVDEGHAAGPVAIQLNASMRRNDRSAVTASLNIMAITLFDENAPLPR
jgi:hypothetical protein